jgi:DNA-directed RNA polymerase
MDYRGRLNDLSYFNFQRADHVRGLFLIADPEPIGADGLSWFKAHVAGRADGNDWSGNPKPSRLNFEQRIAWTESNMPRLQRIGKDVLRGTVPDLPKAMLDDEEPVQFLAACVELVKALEDGRPSFLTHLPLTFDASSNGLQHLSAITRDEVGGRYANLIPSDEGQDFYQHITDLAAERFTDRWFVKFKDSEDKIRLETFPTKKAADREAKKKIDATTGYIDAKIDRKLGKQPVMTYFYGAAPGGSMTGQVAKVLKERGSSTTIGSSKIARTICAAIEDEVPSAKAVRNFLRRLARPCAKHGILLRWITPLGMPVLNLAYEPDVKGFAGRLPNGRRKWVNLAIDDKDEIDKNAAIRRAAPNFVHALEAAHLQMVAYEAAHLKGMAMASVHDCYACLASRAAPFNEIIRDRFVALHERFFVLRNIWLSARQDLPPDIKLPPLPPSGKLDLKQVLHSYHAFK